MVLELSTSNAYYLRCAKYAAAAANDDDDEVTAMRQQQVQQFVRQASTQIKLFFRCMYLLSYFGEIKTCVILRNKKTKKR